MSEIVAPQGPQQPQQPAGPPEPGQPRTWDIVATTVELIVLALAGMVSSFAGLMLVMASDSCGTGTTECSTGIILLGVGLAVVAPWVALLTVHGVLHLLGYDHAEPDEEKEMFALQNRILEEWYEELRRAEEAELQAARDNRLLGKTGFARGTDL